MPRNPRNLCVVPGFRPSEAPIRSRLAREEERAIFAELLRRKRDGLPVHNSLACLRIAPAGRVGNGLHPDRPLGNVFEQSLKGILQSNAMLGFRAEAGGCLEQQPAQLDSMERPARDS